MLFFRFCPSSRNFFLIQTNLSSKVATVATKASVNRERGRIVFPGFFQYTFFPQRFRVYFSFTLVQLLFSKLRSAERGLVLIKTFWAYSSTRYVNLPKSFLLRRGPLTQFFFTISPDTSSFRGNVTEKKYNFALSVHHWTTKEGVLHYSGHPSPDGVNPFLQRRELVT